MGSASRPHFKSRNHCPRFHINIPPPRDELSCGRLVAWLMSACAHPHKRRRVHANTHSDGSHRLARACTHTHIHTSNPVVPCRFLSVAADACCFQTGSSSRLPGTRRGKPCTPDPNPTDPCSEKEKPGRVFILKAAGAPLSPEHPEGNPFLRLDGRLVNFGK